jgi:4-amino-4-deoxy-L-arabinose transferase-like glycosyltransferase
MKGHPHDLRILLLALLGLTLWRVTAALHAQPELFFDEAQYWDWAQHPAWGYYSKPPMLAWLISLFTAVLGDSILGNSELAVRAPSFILYPAGAIMLYLSTRRLLAWQPELHLPHAPLWAALAYISLPVVSLGSWLITTDAALLFFWSAALWAFVRAVDHDRWGDWLVLGLLVGAGLLSKYTMAAFGVAALGWALTSRRDLLLSPKPYAALAVALILFSPNLLWNAQHHFASFQHTAEISQLDRALLHPGKMLEFLAAQFVVFGPLLFAGLIWLCVRPRQRITQQPALRLLAWFALLPLLSFLGLALLSRAFANWAAFAYVAATPLVVIALLQAGRRRWLIGAMLINLSLGAAIYHYHDITRLAGIELSKKTDPYHRITGWRTFGLAVAEHLAAHPEARLLCTERELITELLYYARPRARPAYFWNLSGRIQNHYALMNDLRTAPNGSFLLVGGPSDPVFLRQHFATVTPLPEIVIPIHKDLTRRYSVALVSGYLGK